MARRARTLPAILLLAAAYFAVSRLALESALGARSPLIPAVWPAAGLAVAVLLRFGLRLAPGVAIGAFVFAILRSGSPVAAMGVAAGAAAGALVPAWLLTRTGRFDTSLRRTADVLMLAVCGAGAGAALSVSGRVFNSWWRGILQPQDIGWTWLKWWGGDALGVLLAAPLILTWATRSHQLRWTPRAAAEAAVLLVSAAMLTHQLFAHSSNYAYAVFPVAGWAALRFGPRGAATISALIAVGAISYTLKGQGPFAEFIPTNDVFQLQIFLALVALTALVLAANVEERRRAEDALEARLRQQAALLELGRRAMDSGGAAALMQHAADIVARTLGTEFCKILELLPDRQTLLLRAGVGWRDGYVGHATVPAGQGSMAGYTLERGEPVLVEDLAEERRFSAPSLLRDHGVVSGASVTIPGRTAPFGVLGCDRNTRHRFSSDDTQFLQSVANILGSAIEREMAEWALESARLRIRHLITTSTTVFYATRWEGDRFDTTYVSENITRVSGYSVEEALAPAWWTDHLHPDDRERVTTALPRLLAEGGHVLEYRFQFSDGSYHWIFDEGTVRHELGGGRELVGSWMDITARKRVELLFTSLLDATPDAIVVTRDNGEIVLVNRQTETLFGYGRYELLGQSIDLLVPEHIRTRYEQERTVYVGAPHARTIGLGLDLSGRRKDGSEFPVEISLSPLRTDDGLLVIAAVRDISQRRSLEDRLRQSQRLESVGRLAAGIAHDFNNLLTTIIGYGDLLREEMGPSSEHLPNVVEVMKAADRAAMLTQQLLAFSRKQILQPRVLDPNAVVADMQAMVSRLIGEHIRLVTHLDATIGRVAVDPGQLEQVVINLAVNARDAMPEGGTLTIETANVDLDETYASHHVGVKPGAYVRLTVSDTGTGMDPETQAHIFEPFFTTKARGEGTGLGLATVYGIAKQSGGNVWAYSEPGHGTTFKFYLPRVAEPQDRKVSPAAPQPPARGSETVLVVEDEDGVRSIIRRILENRGYTVLDASNGPDALAVSDAHAGAIDLLLTDVVLPQMSGRAVAEAVTARRPAIKVLFMSGYTDDAIVHHGMLDAGLAFLQKPFTAQALAERVRAVLGEPGA